MAACYAMYKTLFKDGYPFSYDLGEIGRYYIGYRRLMDHWQATLPGAIHSIGYEALVADPLVEAKFRVPQSEGAALAAQVTAFAQIAAFAVTNQHAHVFELATFTHRVAN